MPQKFIIFNSDTSYKVIRSNTLALIIVNFLQTGIGITIAGGATIDNPTCGIHIKKIVDVKSPLKKGENIVKVQ